MGRRTFSATMSGDKEGPGGRGRSKFACAGSAGVRHGVCVDGLFSRAPIGHGFTFTVTVNQGLYPGALKRNT